MRRKLAPRRARKERARDAVQSVVDETIALYQWLAWVADHLYGDDARGATRRWIVRHLMRDGAQTVSALARARRVRRQSVQPIVDALGRDKLVVAAPNPDDARSPLVKLTARGADLAERFDRVDRAVLRAVSRGIAPRDLAVTTSTLRALRRSFETRMKWGVAAASVRVT